MTEPTTPKAKATPAVVLPLATGLPSPEEQRAALENLRRPFEGNQISKLPKAIVKAAPGTKPTYLDCKPGTQASADGIYCGGRHPRSIHLDYVGHAALTDRLLQTDLRWEWEPLSISEIGLPQFDREGGMWIKLTVAGMTRLGYGDSQGKTGPNAVKEAIGDALRNAGMRFGMALDLWHKGDLHDADAEQGQVVTPDGERAEPTPDIPAREWVKEAAAAANSQDFVLLWREAKKLGVDDKIIKKMVDEGEKIRDREAKEAAAKEFAEGKANDAVKEGFEGPSDSTQPE
jgi:hypothetical protein